MRTCAIIPDINTTDHPSYEFPGLDPDLLPGARVGEYVVEGKIGQGGFGAVFKATHPLIGKQVAIKVLNREYSANPQMVSRFVAEARVVNQIGHRGIIDIFSFDQLDDGRHYYAMELLEGQTLDQLLGERGRLPLDEALPLLRAVARALDAAHDNGVAHRDLKPANVFVCLDSDGSLHPKLLDFGLAKLLANDGPSLTQSGVPMGTPYYMSPEQCRGRDVDHRTDIYSFGVMAYLLVTGRVPFEGTDSLAVLVKHVNEMPLPPSRIQPDLPISLDRAILWCLAKEPANRPPSLAAAMSAIEQAARAADQGETRSALAPATEARAAARPGWTRERSLAFALGALIVVLGGVGVVAVDRLGAKSRRAIRAVPSPVPPVMLSADIPPAPQPEITRTIVLEVAEAPQGTEVVGPQGILGTAPGSITLPQGGAWLRLELRKEGFEPRTLQVLPDKDQRLTVRLDPVKQPAKQRGRIRKRQRIDDLEDFGD